jgi:hypothetical protein
MVPRLDYIDVEAREELLRSRQASVPARLAEIRAEPEKLPQTRYSLLASTYRYIALYLYALGYPLQDVREALTHAAQAWLKVFELRGQEEAFPAYVLTYDPTKEPTDPGSHQIAPLHPPGTMDYSSTNSQKGYLAVCAAQIGGDDELAGRLAALIWDPPDADYIGRRSEVCTPNDQRLAYALRELFAGNNDGVRAELQGIRAGLKESYDTDQATMIRALVTGDTYGFRDALDSYLDWHRRRALDKRNIDRVDFYLSLPALALCGQAVRRNVCPVDLFPQENVFLPLELIR